MTDWLATAIVITTFLPSTLLIAKKSRAANPGETGNQAAAVDSTEFKSLFDGETLRGWEGDKKWFTVRDKTIVAGSATEAIPHNYFLCSEKTYRDFELIVEAKLVGKGDNAGVQFRTKRIPNDTEVIGYQADIGFFANGTCWGALYDESRRRKFLAEDQEKAQKAVKRGQWNELRIVAKGDHIQIFLNGVQTVDYTEQDPEIEKDGVIALQVHAGPQLEAIYRNVRIREL
ncbi:DUF1080 domain-containing protein [Rhodopirellula sp. MGV]|uniref:3-keto-disaccharide hydrolase n=1 Tax=Rhodopirellula sp. MGV TaxID=2023130 RepID=UPI000B96D0F6|nr:DUF1080 domain-containing protein [Rhodopirellula sp. MGV]OYP28881.1 hypothetical protein CGZ80_25255 [Rhodopirellula sp. MGV]PNY37002.1 DUF1080 domain-containing protein [Rhodopirellula baltica]